MLKYELSYTSRYGHRVIFKYEISINHLHSLIKIIEQNWASLWSDRSSKHKNDINNKIIKM